MNLVSVVDQHSRSHPDSPALVGDDPPTSYAELRRLTSRFASDLLQRGVRPGDRVAILLTNGLPFVVGFLGCLRLGAVPVPLNVRLRPEDTAALMRNVGAEVLLCPRDVHHRFRNVRELIDADSLLEDLETPGLADYVPPARAQWRDVSNIIFTSGSTAQPKGVLQTHGMHLSTGAALAEFYQLSSADSAAIVSPLFHIAGLTMLSAALHVGGPFALVPSSKPDHVVRALDRHHVAYLHLVGTVLSDLITAEQSAPSPCRLPSLRHLIYGGAAISDEKLRWFEERFGCRITTSYGRSEGGKTWCAPDSDQRWRTHGPVNRDVCELRIVDPKTGLETPVGVPGEIRVRGDGVSLGYWERPDLNAQVFDRDGWMLTGDRGFIDDEQFLHFLGRADGMIKTGGENVSPQEVEQALAQVDGVDDVVVAGVPHPRLGQTVGALIVAKAGSSAQQIQDAARRHLAGFKLPRVIRLVDELPRLGSNKLDMPKVSTLLEEQVGFETEGMRAAT